MAELHFEPVAVEHTELDILLSALRQIDIITGVRLVCFAAPGLVDSLRESVAPLHDRRRLGKSSSLFDLSVDGSMDGRPQRLLL